ncbi:1,4-dihydroxy-2-naphthoyl-CoA hydrolase domain protein [Lyngbya aestuarii BL J]|uniref:1,4-dihydroxy-2-naphthoyl-CoA hydrolase n=1 Tax=Lyngbya aestuarii BL J TaxID=1348334 RepID=U7QP62_9CYAN|nr:1,4-dihydroxy-2-naphthoyl-CoA hydrolase domain protein [Lyngbya aestuarii BL J]
MAYIRTVRFQDTDAAGVVYFANILTICHEAYEASLAAAKINLKTFFCNPDFAIPIVHTSVDFFQPLFCGDRLLIHLMPQQITENTFEINYNILLHDSEKWVAKAITKHVCIHPNSRIRQQLPDEILHWLNVETIERILNSVDAVVVWNNGKAYFFKDDEYLSYDLNWNCIDYGYPQKISQGRWASFPARFTQGIDAGLVWNNGKAYFFKGDEYVCYDLYKDQVEAGYPQKLNSGLWVGWPKHFYSGIDTAALWKNGKAYFFKGDEYICYDLYREVTELGYPKKIADTHWQGWPKQFTRRIDAAAVWKNGKAYFFRDDEYICYDVNRNCTDPGYPKKIKDNWLSFWCQLL